MIDKKRDNLGPLPQIQLGLFHVEKQVEHDGVEMGVLDNGVPYLTESGLARMCGIDRKVLNRLAINWPDEKVKPRGAQIAELLKQSGYSEETLYLKSDLNGKEINAYTEPVCMALLEYYAFVAPEKRPEAIGAFRSLARTTFRGFIYSVVKYIPDQKKIDSWKHFHDRVDMLLGSVPAGYYCIFSEIATMIIPMIRVGVLISDKTVPDISVGIAWGKYWRDNNLNEKYGQRKTYDHEYPDYYPQAASNPQESYAYPDSSLGEFREWLRETYIMDKFPKYLLNQAKQGKLPPFVAQQAIETFAVKAIDSINAAQHTISSNK